MTSIDSTKLMVKLARENARSARREKALSGARNAMTWWYEGRAQAYMIAARILNGGISARTRNHLKAVA